VSEDPFDLQLKIPSGSNRSAKLIASRQASVLKRFFIMNDPPGRHVALAWARLKEDQLDMG
jgi:hypothetical protein